MLPCPNPGSASARNTPSGRTALRTVLSRRGAPSARSARRSRALRISVPNVQNARFMRPAPRLAWLFDVDGTLLLTEGAAREAFVHAVRVGLEVEDDLRDIGFAGRTEPWILADILSKYGRT